jgi:hypothetical protein
LKSIYCGINFLCIGIWLAAFQAAGGHTQGKAEATMAKNIVISIQPVAREVLSGEQLFIKISLTNTSDHSISMPDIYSKSPFFYEINGKSGSIAVSQASAVSRDIGQDVAPPDETPKMKIDPGATVETTEDLAEYMEAPLKIGAYTLTARMVIAGERIVSAPATFAISGQVPSFMSTIFCPLRHVGSSILTHSAKNGGTVLYQRDCNEPHMDRGVFIKRAEIPKGETVQGVSVAAQIGTASEGRWFACLTSTAILATRGWGVLLNPAIQRLDIKMTRASIVDRGFQLADLNAVFFVFSGEKNNPILTGYSASADGIKEKMKISLGTGIPAEVKVAAQDGMADNLTVVWIAKKDKGYSLHCKKITKSHSSENEIMLYSSQNILSGLSLDIFGTNPEGCCIEGPLTPSNRYACIRFTINEKPILKKENFIVPSGSASQISAQPCGTATLLAAVLDKTVAWRTIDPKDTWRVIGHEESAVSNVQLLHVTKEPVWIQWFSTISGLRFSKLAVHE